MMINKLKHFQILIFFSLLTIIGCNTEDKKNQNVTEKNNDSALLDSFSILRDVRLLNDSTIIDTLEIIVVQCANGYEYAMHNYDFNPVIENELNKFENIKVKPFPYKTLMGVTYQGVFDKKYCPPIIEKVNVDYLILTRFDKRYDELNRTGTEWGYEVRIVNTKTLEQSNSISAYNLKEYEQIEKNIRDNIGVLKADIERFK